MNWLLKTIFALWLRGRLLLNKILSNPAAIPGPLSLKGEKIHLPFLEGANLPWLYYGVDFGANAWSPDGGVGKPESRETLRSIFLELNELGIHTVRWFLLCDGRSPVILAWDIVNEPEWATRGCGGVSGTAIAFLTMRRFIKKTAHLVHRYTRHLATVGLGNAAGLPLVRYTGLDFYQVHWYDRWNAVAPLERPVQEWSLDRPLLLGEFPTKNSARLPETIVEASKKSGYCGALAWSVLGTDRASGIDLDNEETLG
jgi:hypothetical protein